MIFETTRVSTSLRTSGGVRDIRPLLKKQYLRDRVTVNLQNVWHVFTPLLETRVYLVSPSPEVIDLHVASIHKEQLLRTRSDFRQIGELCRYITEKSRLLGVFDLVRARIRGPRDIVIQVVRRIRPAQWGLEIRVLVQFYGHVPNENESLFGRICGRFHTSS